MMSIGPKSGYSNNVFSFLLLLGLSTIIIHKHICWSLSLRPLPVSFSFNCEQQVVISSRNQKQYHPFVHLPLLSSFIDATISDEPNGSLGIKNVTPNATTSSSSTIQQKTELDSDQVDFIIGYLNKHHTNFLTNLAEAFSTLGSEMAKANAFSGGSMIIQSAKMTQINYTNNEIELDVQVQRRGGGFGNFGSQEESYQRNIKISLDSNPIRERERYYTSREMVDTLAYNSLDPIDVVTRKLCRLAWIVNLPEITGKFIQLAIQLHGSGVGKLPENMFLNQVPHNRFVRQWFYDIASEAVKDAVVLCSDGKITNRMKVISKFPETNPTMDSYRIGTILELVRTIAIRLVEENLRVRVCVQGSMGAGIFTGLPKQLSGVSRLLQAMDWQSGDGEINAGMVGDYIRFGEVGKNHVLNTIVEFSDDGTKTIKQYQDDVFIIIAPQSMIGVDSSIMPSLVEMTIAAGDRPIILINPDLTDKISSGGQQSVRGRQQRIDFENSFETIFHFQNIYISGTSYFPILGATTKLHPTKEPWIAHQRRDLLNGEELYVPVLADETLPDGASILQAFER